MARKVAPESPAGEAARALPPPVVEPALSLASWDDAERLLRARRESIVEVEQPLVLVSQVQRSGGTLLNNLLDGHPELYVHPYELHIGHPTKADWPSLDLDGSPDDWLEALSESVTSKLFEGGYRKWRADDGGRTPAPLPFTIVPTFVEHLFRLLCGERRPKSQREIVDRYLTAYFNAWIDNQGLREQPKRWVAAFGPRLAWGDSRRRFVADYPDGRLIACLREPKGWWASASRFSERYGEIDAALGLWQRGAEEIARAKRERPETTFVITYRALVTEPERTMRSLADWLGIGWHPCLATPTFNRLPTVANSSHDIDGSGVSTLSLERWRELLDAETPALVDARTAEAYSAALAVADLA